MTSKKVKKSDFGEFHLFNVFVAKLDFCSETSKGLNAFRVFGSK
jgi:hypothetical protein